jgi:hypothetical protein
LKIAEFAKNKWKYIKLRINKNPVATFLAGLSFLCLIVVAIIQINTFIESSNSNQFASANTRDTSVLVSTSCPAGFYSKDSWLQSQGTPVSQLPGYSTKIPYIGGVNEYRGAHNNSTLCVKELQKGQQSQCPDNGWIKPLPDRDICHVFRYQGEDGCPQGYSPKQKIISRELYDTPEYNKFVNDPNDRNFSNVNGAKKPNSDICIAFNGTGDFCEIGGAIFKTSNCNYDKTYSESATSTSLQPANSANPQPADSTDSTNSANSQSTDSTDSTNSQSTDSTDSQTANTIDFSDLESLSFNGCPAGFVPKDERNKSLGISNLPGYSYDSKGAHRNDTLCVKKITSGETCPDNGFLVGSPGKPYPSNSIKRDSQGDICHIFRYQGQDGCPQGYSPKQKIISSRIYNTPEFNKTIEDPNDRNFSNVNGVKKPNSDICIAFNGTGDFCEIGGAIFKTSNCNYDKTYSSNNDSDDSDDDGIPDNVECKDGDPKDEDSCKDTDKDGIPDYLDLDSDNDGALDSFEGKISTGVATTTIEGFTLPDMDGDNTPDHLDSDSDGDGVWDLIEANDVNADGVNDNTSVSDEDFDGMIDTIEDDNKNGVDDSYETTPAEIQSSDTLSSGTPLPDIRNSDDDGDGVLTKYENPDSNGDGNLEDKQDTDSDGTPDYLDPDDDGDSINTDKENPDPNGDGNPSDAIDSDDNDIPDYLDPNFAIRVTAKPENIKVDEQISFLGTISEDQNLSSDTCSFEIKMPNGNVAVIEETITSNQCNIILSETDNSSLNIVSGSISNFNNLVGEGTVQITVGEKKSNIADWEVSQPASQTVVSGGLNFALIYTFLTAILLGSSYYGFIKKDVQL